MKLTTKQIEDLLIYVAYQSGITSSKELSNLMAQISADTENFKLFKEDWDKKTKELSAPLKTLDPEEIKKAVKKAQDGAPEQLTHLIQNAQKDTQKSPLIDPSSEKKKQESKPQESPLYKDLEKVLCAVFIVNPVLAVGITVAVRVAVHLWDKLVHAFEDKRETPEQAAKALGAKEESIPARVESMKNWEKKLTPERIEQAQKTSQQLEKNIQLEQKTEIKIDLIESKFEAAKTKVHELFDKLGMDFDKQHGLRTSFAVAQLAAEKGIDPIEFIGIDKTNGRLSIGKKEGEILNIATMPTTEIGAVSQESATRAILALVNAAAPQQGQNPTPAITEQLPQTHGGQHR